MLTETEEQQLRQGAAAWGIHLDAVAIRQFSRFAELLAEGNRRLNLTRIPVADTVTLHFLDSLALAAVFKPEANTTLIDVGTGAGFPGLPLALAFPELKVTLLDGTRKRLDFVQAVIVELGLRNAATLHGRAEDLARLPDHAGAYDVATARAVAKLPALAAWMLPLIRHGGRAIAYKSRGIAPELGELGQVVARLGGTIESVVEVDVPFTEIVRALVVMRRVGPARSRSGSRERGAIGENSK